MKNLPVTWKSQKMTTFRTFPWDFHIFTVGCDPNLLRFIGFSGRSCNYHCFFPPFLGVYPYNGQQILENHDFPEDLGRKTPNSSSSKPWYLIGKTQKLKIFPLNARTNPPHDHFVLCFFSTPRTMMWASNPRRVKHGWWIEKQIRHGISMGFHIDISRSEMLDPLKPK